MGDYFKPWRRKSGVVTLVMACVLSVAWARSRSVNDVLWIQSGNYREFSLLSGEGTLTVTYGWPVEVAEFLKSHSDYGWTTSEKGTASGHRFRWWAPIGSYKGGRYVQTAPIWVPNHSAEQPLLHVWFEYWLFAIPLTLLSAYLLLSKPRKSTQMKITEPISETAA